MALDPTDTPPGAGERGRLTDPQRLEILLAQLNDPARDPASTPELTAEIARMQQAAATTAPADVRIAIVDGQRYTFPANATDADIAQALASLRPQATQADVRKHEPQPMPMAEQSEKEARFADAHKRYVQATGGVIPPGKNIRQAVEEWSGIQDPTKTRDAAELDEMRAGGNVTYGDSVPYAASKGLAAMGGFAGGGPAGATGAEALVRLSSLTFNLKRAVDAGAITQERAAEMLAKEMATGTSEDALFNFGLPLLGQVIAKIPGAQWLGDKVVALLKSKGVNATTHAEDLTAQRDRALERLTAGAQTQAGKDAVQEIGRRTQDVVPTPGQVTGQASTPEIAARISGPQKFKEQGDQINAAAEGMRQDLVNPATQPSAKALGEQITKTAEEYQAAVKKRLRPTFEAADELGVKIDFTPVLARAKAALAADAQVPGGRLVPQERAALVDMIADLEKLAKPAQAETTVASAVLGPDGKPVTRAVAAEAAVPPLVGAEQALDFISRQKERVRATTADWKPSKYFETIMGGLTKDADAAYTSAAGSAGRDDVVKNLIGAQNEYRTMMATVYEDAIKQALKKNPEDVGRLFWQAGNVSEIQQLNKLLQLATKEKTMTPEGALKLQGDMTRGFLQEAVRDLPAAAKWSETVKSDPLKRRTWETLTAAPGGAQLRGAMEVLEQAAQMAGRSTPELVGQIGMAAIPIRRAAGLGIGVSYVTGVIHPGMAILGLSLDGLTRLMATAYTQGNRGVLNATMRALRANSAGTAAGAKALQESLPEIEKFAAANNITDIFVGDQRKAQ